MTEQELYHYGVLGMHWGVRRYQNKDGTRTAEGKRRERKQDIYQESKRLSDAELQKTINRLRSESEYQRLREQDIDKGRADAHRALAKIESFALAAGGIAVGVGAASAGKSFAKTLGQQIGKNAANAVGDEINPDIADAVANGVQAVQQILDLRKK